MEGAATGTRAGALALATTVAAVAVAFLIAMAPWATEDFGYSLDGFNGSVWGLGARAAADDPLGSRLGGIQPDGDRYANHPPLTVWTAAIGSAVSGDRPGAVRAPALVASVLALAALAVVLSDAGLRREAVAAGVALAGTSGMFLTYGAMLDTPVVGLPFGLAAVAAAQRVWQGRPPPTGVLVLAGALAVLSGWQAALAAGFASGVAGLARPSGHGRSVRRGAVALAVGVAVGTAATATWIVWVHGGLDPLLDQAGVRTGRFGPGTEAGWWEAMGSHLTDLYGPWPVLAALGVALVVAIAAPLGRPNGGRGHTDAGTATRPDTSVAGAGTGTTEVAAWPEGHGHAGRGTVGGGQAAAGAGATETGPRHAIGTEDATDDGTTTSADGTWRSAAGPSGTARAGGRPGVAAVEGDSPGVRAAGAAWWRPAGLRPVAVVLVATVGGYTALFRNGAAVHDYWTYWGVALVAVAGAAVVDLVLTRTPLRRLPRVAAVLLVAVVVVPLAVVGGARQTTAETRIRHGLELLPVLGEVPEASDPDTVAVAVYGAPGELPWADHLLHGRAVDADDVRALRRLPRDLPVLVVLRGPPSPALRSIAIARNRRFALVPAGALARHLGG